MLGVAMYITIKTLWETGSNKSEIARLTGHDWKTISTVIKTLESGKDKPEMKRRTSLVDPFKERVVQLLEQNLSAVRIHEELISSEGFIGSYSAVKKYVRKLKRKENIFIRVHTPPGYEAQVDFGYVGLTPDDTGKRRKTWVFNMRLSHSRLDYYEKVYNQKVETFINCHINAFEYFGGVPEVVKIDNLKAAILEANFYEPVFQEMYKIFSQYYRFKPVPCRVYRPNDKGKVESGIKYVKSNFFKGRKFTSSADCDRQLKNWLEKANRRIHGTTRKVPFDIFTAEESSKLHVLPKEKYQLPQMGTRHVYHDCHIYVDYNYYSVPFEYAGKEVEIELGENLLKIYYKCKEIALHKRAAGKGNFTTNSSHYPKYKQYCETEYQEKYQVKMAQIGIFAEQLFFLILKTEKNNWPQPVKGILSLTKTHSYNVVNLACKRALAYDVCKYRIIKNICETGSYALPLEYSRSREVFQ